MADDSDDETSPLRTVGSAIGGFARRLGRLVTDVSETVTVREATRTTLTEARSLRVAGLRREASAVLARARADNDDPWLATAAATSWVESRIFPGGDGVFQPPTLPDDDVQPQRSAADLLHAVQSLDSGDAAAALDHLRRARGTRDRHVSAERGPFLVAIHGAAALTYRALGQRERAIREVRKARAHLDLDLPDDSALPRARLLDLGVELMVAEGRRVDAERWLAELNRNMEPSPRALGWEALVRAGQGDVERALALFDAIAERGFAAEVEDLRVRAALLVDPPDEARSRALEHLRADASNPDRLRLWALAEVRTWDGRASRASVHEVLGALASAAQASSPGLHRAHIQELAHVALRADALDHPGLEAYLGSDDPAILTDELRLARARVGGPATGGAGRRHGGPDPQGPDEVSPLRDEELRRRILVSHRALVRALEALRRNDLDGASEDLVEALVADPDNRRAADALRNAGASPVEPRLEAVLSESTAVLAGLPPRVQGIALEGIPGALAGVIAARERLARPLTIAIMGEFSSGKSSFVNALLGATVAPTGVLPTTSTINVFRNGPSGGARVHYRDGRIGVVGPDEVEPFLHGLDDVEAGKIRFVEIERSDTRMGDTAVVDTPGLNALDPYHERVAREFLDEADAVVWIFSATRSGSASEAAMLAELREGGRQVLGVLNKIDTLRGDEREELEAYLQEKLGEVLVEVVPLCATRAVAFRTASPDAPGGEERGTSDPFEGVDRALEQHFLRRARELKRELTKRRLHEALAQGRAAVDEVAGRLEAVADQNAGEVPEHEARRRLRDLGDAVGRGILQADDPISREWLASGVVRAGDGLARLDGVDVDYLGVHVEEVLLHALEQALADLESDDPDLAHLVADRLVPWARGYLDAFRRLDALLAALQERGPAAREGEAELRLAVRAWLGTIADAWCGELREQRNAVIAALAAQRRRSSSAPRAQALRLRATVVAHLDALRDTLDDAE